MTESAETEEEEGHKFVRLTRLQAKTNVLNDYELQTALLKGFHREGPDALKCKVNWNKAKDEREAVLEFETGLKAKEAKRRWNGKNSFTVDFRGLGAEVIEEPVGWVKSLPSEKAIYRAAPKTKYPERPPMNPRRNQNQGRYGGYSQRNDAGYQNSQQRNDNWGNQNADRQQQQRRNNRGWENKQNDGWGANEARSNRRKADDGWGAQNNSSRDKNDNWGQGQEDNWEQNNYQRSPNKREAARPSSARPQQRNDDWDDGDDGWSNEQPQRQPAGSGQHRDEDWGSVNRGKQRRQSRQQSPPRTNNHNEGWGPGPAQDNDHSRSQRDGRDSSSSRSNRRSPQKDEGWGPSQPAGNDDWRHKQNGQQKQNGWAPQNEREREDDRQEQHSNEQRKSKSRQERREYPKQKNNREVVNKAYTPGKHDVKGRQERAPTPPLPPKWKRAFCPRTNRPYYWHSVTKAVQWSIPTLEGAVPPPPPDADGKARSRQTSDRRRRREQSSRKSGSSSRQEYSYDE